MPFGRALSGSYGSFQYPGAPLRPGNKPTSILDPTGFKAAQASAAQKMPQIMSSARQLSNNLRYMRPDPTPEPPKVPEAEKPDFDLAGVLSAFTAQQAQIAENNNKMWEDKFNSLSEEFTGAQSAFADQVAGLQGTIDKMGNSFSPTTQVGTSNQLGGMGASSEGTPMTIKKKGTGRFNRDNNPKYNNALKIGNLNV